jgi:hypothetical protein
MGLVIACTAVGAAVGTLTIQHISVAFFLCVVALTLTRLLYTTYLR